MSENIAAELHNVSAIHVGADLRVRYENSFSKGSDEEIVLARGQIGQKIRRKEWAMRMTALSLLFRGRSSTLSFSWLLMLHHASCAMLDIFWILLILTKKLGFYFHFSECFLSLIHISQL
jgi:hypothetical protein